MFRMLGAAVAAAQTPVIQREAYPAQAPGKVHTIRIILEVCAYLQGSFTADPAKPYANALVIMINEQASSDHIQAALGEGADGYIVKPFRPATLLDHLVQAITGQKTRPVE